MEGVEIKGVGSGWSRQTCQLYHCSIDWWSFTVSLHTLPVRQFPGFTCPNT